MKKSISYFFLIPPVVLLLANSLTLTGCQNMAGAYAPIDSGQSLDNSGQMGLAVKNYEQIYATMGALTSIDPTVYSTSTIQFYYTNNQLALPQSNSIQDLQPSHLITITNLAAEFCFGLFEDFGCNNGTNCASRVRAFFQGTSLSNFNQQSHLYTVLTPASTKIEVAHHMLNQFWGAEAQPSINRQQAEDSLVTLITDLMDGFSTSGGGTFNDLKKVLEGACTAALASGPVIYF